jgi:hypothetical protein
MRDAAAWAEKPKWRLGEHLARMDQSKWTYGLQCGTQGSGREILENRKPGGRTSSRRRLVDSGHIRHEFGRRGGICKGDSNRRPNNYLSRTSFPVEVISSYQCKAGGRCSTGISG